MIMTSSGIVALPRTQNGEPIGAAAGKFSFVYQQVESFKPMVLRPPRPGWFGVEISFYNRTADASKIIVVTFECKESIVSLDSAVNLEETKDGDNAALAAEVNEKLMKCDIDEMMVIFMHSQLSK